MNRKEFEKLLKRMERLEQENERLKKKSSSKKEEWIEVSSNIVKKKEKPIAYALLQKKKGGKKKRLVIGGYCTIAKKDINGEIKDYYLETKVTRKGKKVKGYFVPRKKGSVILEKKELEKLTKGF